MTRRIVAAILLAIWSTLIIGGAVAYLALRSVMLDELDASIAARALALAGAGGDAAGAVEHPGDRYLIADQRGQTVARAAVDASSLRQANIISRSFAVLGDGARMRTLTLKAASTQSADPAQTLNIVYSSSAAGFDRTLTHLAWALSITGLAAGALAAVVTITVARRALKPLYHAAAVIGAIDERALGRRLEIEPLPVELKPVAVTINHMLARLGEAFEQRRRFMADASHELRTPVAALTTALEVALRRPRNEDELRETLRNCLDDVVVLRSLVERLLEQVRSEHYSDEGPVEQVPLAACIAEASAVVAPLAQRREIRLHQSCDPQLQLTTQRHRLLSIIVNLLANAIEHHQGADGGGGGNVWVAAQAVNGEAAISVRDDGPGIARADQARVFDPFFRGSISRSPAGGHLGLGLFLVQSHARALGGRCELESEPGSGSTFRVLLPRDRPVQERSPASSGALAAEAAEAADAR